MKYIGITSNELADLKLEHRNTFNGWEIYEAVGVQCITRVVKNSKYTISNRLNLEEIKQLVDLINEGTFDSSLIDSVLRLGRIYNTTKFYKDKNTSGLFIEYGGTLGYYLDGIEINKKVHFNYLPNDKVHVGTCYAILYGADRGLYVVEYQVKSENFMDVKHTLEGNGTIFTSGDTYKVTKLTKLYDNVQLESIKVDLKFNAVEKLDYFSIDFSYYDDILNLDFTVHTIIDYYPKE